MRAETIACTRCGRIDGTLRLAHYLWVVSILLLSFRRAAGGVLCARCRLITNASCSILTALAGWWGFPWGLIWTPQALFVNLRGGHRSGAANSALLAALSGQLREAGEGLAGTEAFNTALGLDADTAREAAAHPVEAAATVGGITTGGTSKAADVLRFASAGAVLLLLASVVGGALAAPAGGGKAEGLVFEGPTATYVNGTIRVTGNVRNPSQFHATGVWLEVVVRDASTGREVARAKRPASAPSSDVSIPPLGSVPFEVAVPLGDSAPETVDVAHMIHWR